MVNVCLRRQKINVKKFIEKKKINIIFLQFHDHCLTKSIKKKNYIFFFYLLKSKNIFTYFQIKKKKVEDFFFFNLSRLKLQIMRKKKTLHYFSLLIKSPVSNNFLPLISISGSIITTILQLNKKQKYSSLAQMLSCFFIRRNLILLNFFKIELLQKGVISSFSLFWKYLKNPMNEVFWNLFSNNWVFDVKLSKDEIPVFLNTKNINEWLIFSGWYLLSSKEITSFDWFFFKKKVASLKEKKINFFFRYVLTWSSLLFQTKLCFGLKKNSKLKRLPKRQTKKIVNQVQTRFWIW